MGVFKKAVPTQQGLTLLTKVIAGTALLEFTKIAVSDSVLTGDLTTKTNIGHIVQEQPASAVWLEGKSNIKVSAGFSNLELTQGYYARNIGLYAKDSDGTEILYSISVADEEVTAVDWMPPYSGGGGVSSLAVDLIIELTDTSNVDVSLDATAGATVAQIIALSHRVDTIDNDLKTLAKSFYDAMLDREIKSYTGLNSIGIKVGEETIEKIVKALPNGSILMVPVSVNDNANIYPESSNGTMWVRYTDADRVSFEFVSASTSKSYIGHYSTATKKWQGWYAVFAENNIPTAQQVGALYAEQFNEVADDLNTVMLSGLHCRFLRTTANTLNTPYKQGVTTYGTALVISYAETANNGVQIAFISGHNKSLTYYRTMTAGVITEWTTAYLPLGGGTLNGNLVIQGDWYGVSLQNSARTKRTIWELAPNGGFHLYAYTDENNSNRFSVFDESTNLSNAVMLYHTLNGIQKEYKIYGEHNRETSGIPRISISTYQGTGKSGVNNPNTVTFSGKPLFVVVTGTASPDAHYEGSLMFGRGSTYERGARPSSDGYVNVMTWGDNYVKWYSLGTDSDVVNMQKNASGVTYTVIAILQ
jgi:hypothetical protein